MMPLLSLLVFVTLSYVSSGAVDSSTRICIQGGPVPPECPDNNRWNSVTCRYECLPTEKPICIQGGPVPAECPNNNRWNAEACRFECVPEPKCVDSGKKYDLGFIITHGCKTGTCTKNALGQAVWSWYDPSTVTNKPICPYGYGIWNKNTCQWDCPRTCQDGSTPPKCRQQPSPCATVRCGFNTVCVDNFCSNFPAPGSGKCTAQCVTPVQCTKDPCQSPPGQPKCGKNQVCQADYSVGCNYRCIDAPTCEFNGQTFQLNESRPSEDGCNTCACSENGWTCTKKSCVAPTERPVCMIQGGPVPAECPNNNRWNSQTCKFECVCPQNQNCGINGVWDYDNCRCVVNTPRPTDRPVCVQGGPVPAECPNNNRWNSVTCKFECVCPQNQNCGINGVWDYDNCRCVVNTPATPAPTDRPVCIQGGPVPVECPNNNQWNPVTCKFECVPTERPICIQGGPVPAECPDNNRWNNETCRFECLPAPTERPICIQGGPVPAECPNNNQWNPQTCRFECLPHCVTNEGKFVFGGDRFYTKCNGCTCNTDGSASCTRIGCQDVKCYDDTGKAYARGSTITRGCKTATCVKDSNDQSVWKWVDPESQQPPRCNLGPATFNKATCKWSCPNTCADGVAPPLCLVNPCATILCAANSQCVVNQCPNYPNTENGACTASCEPIVNCLVSPCSVNSCGKGQTCVDDYVGGCNYRCKDKFRM